MIKINIRNMKKYYGSMLVLDIEELKVYEGELMVREDRVSLLT